MCSEAKGLSVQAFNLFVPIHISHPWKGALEGIMSPLLGYTHLPQKAEPAVVSLCFNEMFSLLPQNMGTGKVQGGNPSPALQRGFMAVFGIWCGFPYVFCCVLAFVFLYLI